MKFSKKLLFLTAIIFIFMFGNVSAQNLTLNIVNEFKDSRIVVIILEDDGEEIIHNEMATSILNEKLLETGFKPVMDANHAIKLNDAKLLDNVYKGYPEEFIRSLDSVADYLVIGRFTQQENNLDFYDYYAGKIVESPLKSVRVNLKVNVIIYDTGEIISTFVTKGVGIGNNNPQASEKAIEIAANKAADKLTDAFKNLGTRKKTQYLFTITADDYEKLDQIVEDLRAVDSVNSVKIREQREKTIVLSVEANQPPSMIVKLLKERTSLKFYVERLSRNSCKLIFSEEEEDVNDDEKVFDDTDDSVIDDDDK